MKRPTHLSWPKFPNIHALLNQSKIDPEDQVLVLEKLDGSNLGLEICPHRGLVAIHGRKNILWHSGLAPEEPLQGRTFGPICDTLACLETIIPNLVNMSTTLLQKTRAETIIFYGEWYKASPNESAGWHPFGYAVCDKKTKNEKEYFHTMTSKLYEMFVEYNLLPPRIMYRNGTLYQAVERLYETMLEPKNDQFEGVFITLDGPGTGGCDGACKWKTGRYEEQSRFAIKDKISLRLPPRGKDIVARLRDVYETKTKKLTPYVPKWRDISGGNNNNKSHNNNETCEKDLDVERQVTLALHSVLSKSETPLQLMGQAEMDQLKTDTKQDVFDTLEACNDKKPTTQLLQLEKQMDEIIDKLIDEY